MPDCGFSAACPHRWAGIFAFAALVLSLAPQIARAQASKPPSIDCTQTTVVAASTLSEPEQQAIRLLTDEVERRTTLRWPVAHSLPQTGCAVVVATPASLRTLRATERHTDVPFSAAVAPPTHPESFALRTTTRHGRTTVLIEGADARGERFGIGLLLRRLTMSAHRATLDAPLNLALAPAKPIRSHQLGYRAKNNTYDAWDLARFEQQIRDLAVFGANTIQLIAPVSDDAESSPLFPAPALDTLLGVSRILARYGLNCDLYYPEMESDYARPEDVARELKRFEDLVRRMPRLDALWIPGGDPGHTAPALLLPLAAREAAILHRYHPDARVYISAQGMDREHFEQFYTLLRTPPTWLTGVFFGPQSRDGLELERKRLPASLPLLFYPDIGHTMHAQFPVPQWDPAFALTEGREPIDPRPADEQRIYRHFEHDQQGFVTYSEGVNDDVNKMLWSQWGWSSEIPASEILTDYCRYFFSPAVAPDAARGIAMLEANWRGALAANATIEPALQLFKQHASGPLASNWRYQMLLYRATYDAYLQRRFLAEQANQQRALSALREALTDDSALARAQAALAEPLPADVLTLQQNLFTLGGELFHSIGLQLSTKLYGAANWERGANLDHVDIALNDRDWLTPQLQRIATLARAQQDEAIAQLLSHYEHPAGTLYDDLGAPTREPHLVRGSGYDADPEMYAAAIDGVADRLPSAEWNWDALTYAEALYETPLIMHYTQLDRTRAYTLRVLYSGEDYALPLRLVADHTVVIQPPTLRKSNPALVEYKLPRALTADGSLTLEWFRPDGLGGSGRGRQIGSVELIPDTH